MANQYENYEWFIEQNLNEYNGEWIAIIKKKVIAHDKNIKRLLDEVRNKYPRTRPSITKISNMHRIL